MLPNLPDELAQGLFAHDGVYPAVVRFSNSASQPQADAIPDGRGMAIKVLGVKGDMVLADEQGGPTQDFVMINHPVFFARNVKDYLRLGASSRASGRQLARDVAGGAYRGRLESTSLALARDADCRPNRRTTSRAPGE